MSKGLTWAEYRRVLKKLKKMTDEELKQWRLDNNITSADDFAGFDSSKNADNDS